MMLFPNAKINIGLYVTERRSDGYHNLETVFYPIPLRDCLEILPTNSPTSLNVYNQSWEGTMQQNLVWKAWYLLKEMYPEKIGGVAMHLIKQIPNEAGMGGGSADAAFALKALNTLFSLKLGEEKLMALALQLGSDCPFFIKNIPAYATSRGEVLVPCALDLSGCFIVLLCPKFKVATKEAFAKIVSKPAAYDLKLLPTLPIEEWRNYVKNDFEASVFSKYPALALMKEWLYQQGALFASMSGSGSTIYGLFSKKEERFSQHAMGLNAEVISQKLEEYLQLQQGISSTPVRVYFLQ